MTAHDGTQLLQDPYGFMHITPQTIWKTKWFSVRTSIKQGLSELPSLKLTASLPLKMDGWNTILLLPFGMVATSVSRRVPWDDIPLDPLAPVVGGVAGNAETSQRCGEGSPAVREKWRLFCSGVKIFPLIPCLLDRS